jgi:hypothetical protein
MISEQVKNENYDLLTHPVVRALLHHKWIQYGLAYDIFNLITFLLFLILATSSSLSVTNPFSQDCELKIILVRDALN